MRDAAADYAAGIVRKLRDHGFEAYIVGGAVRDMVMGIEPQDYDIATSAGTEVVSRLFDRVCPVGERFGVNVVVIEEIPFEVAQFRTESDYRDGRRPETVTSSDAAGDVKRRDFTMNALLYDPSESRVIDHVGGLEDIHQGIVRTVGEPESRFREDHLRMLRAVRFAARFGFTIDDAVRNAIRRNAPRVLTVSGERIGEELRKMFTGPHPDRALTLLDETALLGKILPEVHAMKGVAQPPEFHPEGDVFEHTMRMLALLGGGASPSLAFGVLLHDAGKPATMTTDDRIRFNRHDEYGAEISRTVLKRLRYPRSMIERVTMLVKNHMRFIHMRDMRESTRRRFMAMDGFGELLELYRLDCMASHGNLDVWRFAAESYRKFREEEPAGKLPSPLITGDDLIEAGYDPGPRMGEMLRMVHDAQLEQRITSRKEAMEFVFRRFPPDRPPRNHERKNTPRDRPGSRDDTPNT